MPLSANRRYRRRYAVDRSWCPSRDVLPKVRFAADSPLEGDGFELPVPREMTTIFEPSCFWFL